MFCGQRWPTVDIARDPPIGLVTAETTTEHDSDALVGAECGQLIATSIMRASPRLPPQRNLRSQARSSVSMKHHRLRVRH